MFEDALLQSSPHRNSVLARIHYLLSALAGALAFALSLYAFPLLLMFASRRALLMAAGTAGGATALYALVLCYVWADCRAAAPARMALGRSGVVAEPTSLSDLSRLLRTPLPRLETCRHITGVCCRVGAGGRAHSCSAYLHSGAASAVADHRTLHPSVATGPASHPTRRTARSAVAPSRRGRIHRARQHSACCHGNFGIA